MPFDDPGPALPPGASDSSRREADEESLIREIQAAADAAAGQFRKVAATASAEARVSVASAVAMASLTLLSVAFIVVAWICLVALGVWLAIEAGWPVAAALFAAAVVNVIAASLFRLWYSRLSGNIGFSRTARLLSG